MHCEDVTKRDIRVGLVGPWAPGSGWSVGSLVPIGRPWRSSRHRRNVAQHYSDATDVRACLLPTGSRAS